MLAVLLDRRARVGAVGAIHTAVPWWWLEHGVAVRAFVKLLTGIRGHRLNFSKDTLRRSQSGFQRDSFHFAALTMADG